MVIADNNQASAPRKRVLILDDHPMARRGMRHCIEEAPDLSVCGEAGDATQAIAAVRALNPDAVVADLSLPGRQGLDVIRELRETKDDMAILVLSGHGESFYAERALRVGARGYLMKRSDEQELLRALRLVLRGETYVSDAVSRRMVDSLAGAPNGPRPPSVDQLSARELEVFRLIGEGLETRELAAKLNMSAKTVEAHRLAIKRKLRLRTGAELARQAVLFVEGRL